MTAYLDQNLLCLIVCVITRYMYIDYGVKYQGEPYKGEPPVYIPPGEFSWPGERSALIEL